MLRTLGRIAAVALMMGNSSYAFAQEKVTIAQSTNSFAFVPFLTTVSMGYFEDVGLDVEIIRTGSGAKNVAAVIGGSADVSIGSTNSMMYARQEGYDIVMFAGLVDQYSSSIVYSKEWADTHGLTEESSMEEMLAAMKGARIGAPGPGGADHLIRYIASMAGLNPDRDLTIVYLGNDASVYPAAIEQGRIDAISLSAPATYIVRDSLDAIWAFNTGVGKVPDLNGYLYIVASARREWLEENPEAARKLNEAFQMSIETLKDPARSIEARDKVHAEHYAEVDPEIFAEMWSDMMQAVPDTTGITHENLEMVADFNNRFEEKKIDPAGLDAAYTADYSSR